MKATLYKKDISDFEKGLTANPDYLDSIIIFGAVAVFTVTVLCFMGVL